MGGETHPLPNPPHAGGKRLRLIRHLPERRDQIGSSPIRKATAAGSLRAAGFCAKRKPEAFVLKEIRGKRFFRRKCDLRKEKTFSRERYFSPETSSGRKMIVFLRGVRAANSAER